MKDIAKKPQAAKDEGFKKLVDAAAMADLLKILDFCVSDNIVKNDAKIILWHMAKSRTKALKNAECKQLCEAANVKLKSKILLFASEVCFNSTNQLFNSM